MIGGAQMQLGSLYPEHLSPKNDGENGISVRDNIMRHAMKFEDIIHENLSYYGCSEGILQRT
jgi:hypothetical protein